MNKSDLIKSVEEITNLDHQQVVQIVNTVFDIIKKSIANDDKVCISGFGTFSMGIYPPHKGINPQTGERIIIDAKKSPKFRASEVFKSEINRE